MEQQKLNGLNGKPNLHPAEDDEQVIVQQLLTATAMFGKVKSKLGFCLLLQAVLTWAGGFLWLHI